MPQLEEDKVEATVERVLADEPFSGGADTRALWHTLERWWNAWVSQLTELQMERPAAFWLYVAALVAVLIPILWHLSYSARTVVRALRRRDEPPSQPDAQVHVRRHDLGPARIALGNGDTQRAVELAWTTVMEALGGTSAPASVRTPRQQVRWLAPGLDAATSTRLSRLLKLHEHACYAGTTPSEGDARRALEEAEALLAGARTGPDEARALTPEPS
jgi:hypothetical protein